MLGITSLDWIFFIVLIASMVLATVRGGILETLLTTSWVMSWLGARFIGPLLDNGITYLFGMNESNLISMASSYFIVFIVLLFVLKRLANKIHDSIGHAYFVIIDHTFGVLFGIIRGIVVMGLVYWGTLWYTSDDIEQPKWLIEAKTRPIMQYSAIVVNDVFLVKKNVLLENDLHGVKMQNNDIYDKLLKPAIEDSQKQNDDNVGYQASERKDLENQLLKLDATSDQLNLDSVESEEVKSN